MEQANKFLGFTPASMAAKISHDLPKFLIFSKNPSKLEKCKWNATFQKRRETGQEAINQCA